MTTPIYSFTPNTIPVYSNFVLMPPTTLYELQHNAAEFKKKCESLTSENEMLRVRLALIEEEIEQRRQRVNALERKHDENNSCSENNNVSRRRDSR